MKTILFGTMRLTMMIGLTAFGVTGCGGDSAREFFGDGGSRVTITGQMQGQTKVVCISSPPANLTPQQIQDVFTANANKAFRWDTGTTIQSRIESDRSCNFDLTPAATMSWEQFSSSTGNQQLADWGSFPAKVDAQGKKTVDVCLRDVQCEDGDILDITLNGTAIARHELMNAATCFSVPVVTGKNYLGVNAVNGTGFKGNCSFEDVNTGEVSVTGGNNTGSVQTYRVRGGQGSYGELIITN